MRTAEISFEGMRWRSDYEINQSFFCTSFASKVRKSLLGRVSTGSGSDLVSDQHAIFLIILDSCGLTRSLPLSVLTRSKVHPDF